MTQLTTNEIEIIRTYACNGVTGAVYSLNGRKCTTLLGKGFDVTPATVAEKIGVAYHAVDPSIAAAMSLGGNRWQKGGHDRIYCNNLSRFSAYFSRSKLSCARVYYDVSARRWVGQGKTGAAVAEEIELLIEDGAF